MLPLLHAADAGPVLCIAVYRHPFDNAASLARTQAWDIPTALACWEYLGREMGAAASLLPALGLCFNSLIERPDTELGRLYEFISRHLPGYKLAPRCEAAALINPDRLHIAPGAGAVPQIPAAQLSVLGDAWKSLQAGGFSPQSFPATLSLGTRTTIALDLADNLPAAENGMPALVRDLLQHCTTLESQLGQVRQTAQPCRDALQSLADELARCEEIFSRDCGRAIEHPERDSEVFRQIERVRRKEMAIRKLRAWLIDLSRPLAATPRWFRARSAFLQWNARYNEEKLPSLPQPAEAIREANQHRKAQLEKSLGNALNGLSMVSAELTKIAAMMDDQPQPDAHAGAAPVDSGIFFDCLNELPEDARGAQLDRVRQQAAKHIRKWKALSIHKPKNLVSIIMPVRNREKPVCQAIQSVLQQSYAKWELIVCDDGSTDHTADVVRSVPDPRVRLLPLQHGGAARARNAGLEMARGQYIAYLDSDNLWHPDFLACMMGILDRHSGRQAAYSDYLDCEYNADGSVRIRTTPDRQFNFERLRGRNYIDLNGFVHRRELYDALGGFNPELARRQDWDLILKYTWLRDPLHIAAPLVLYRRNEKWGQITSLQREETESAPIIAATLSSRLSAGLNINWPESVKCVTILSWDICRNHFAKAFALAEALAPSCRVQLIGFRFFEEPVFPPLGNARPDFETLYIDGSGFPGFFTGMTRALSAIRGDVIYAVKPRLPSLGLALLAHWHSGKPVFLEANDLETVIASPSENDRHQTVDLETADPGDPELLDPKSLLWSRLLDPLAAEIPTLFTHNCGLDKHYGGHCHYMRNIKDEAVYDPDRYSREDIRRSLGFGPEDKIILFGGLLRRHKGIGELTLLLDRLNDPAFKLLFVGSRETAEQHQLAQSGDSRITLLTGKTREEMAKINHAADLVILWLNPQVAASHYQMPYKLTDAIAMGVPVIANAISDLGDLGEQGYLWNVPFGDWHGMEKTIRAIFENPQQRRVRTEAARALYQRQFTYAAARANFALAAHGLSKYQNTCLPAAERFARFFERFHQAAGRRRQADGVIGRA